MGEETARTVQEKYDELMPLIGIMIFHPFQNNYYASFAAFADGLPSDIEKDSEVAFKSSDQYKNLLKIKKSSDRYKSLLKIKEG